MKKLSTEFCKQVKLARKVAGISQSELAAEVGCKQSALSMFEQGQPTKLNDAVVEKLAQRFAIKVIEAEGGEMAPAIGVAQAAADSGFCPNPNCPSHTAYMVDGRRFLKPNRSEEDPVGARFCAVCGEVLERKCPNCGAPVHDGAVCSFCGENYIAIS